MNFNKEVVITFLFVNILYILMFLEGDGGNYAVFTYIGFVGIFTDVALKFQNPGSHRYGYIEGVLIAFKYLAFAFLYLGFRFLLMKATGFTLPL